MGENHFKAIPTVIYGVVLILAAVAYGVLQAALIRYNGGRDSVLGRAIGSDFKGRISVVLYALGIGLAFVNQWISDALYVAVAVLWLIPDTRIEKRITEPR